MLYKKFCHHDCCKSNLLLDLQQPPKISLVRFSEFIISLEIS
jgi:hypothetical protein